MSRPGQHVRTGFPRLAALAVPRQGHCFLTDAVALSSPGSHLGVNAPCVYLTSAEKGAGPSLTLALPA